MTWINMQEASVWSTILNATQSIGDKAWNCRVEHPSWEYKFGMKESNGNILNPTIESL